MKILDVEYGSTIKTPKGLIWNFIVLTCQRHDGSKFLIRKYSVRFSELMTIMREVAV